MQRLIIDGWHLEGRGIGLSAYAERLIRGLFRRETDLGCEIQIAVPASRDMTASDPLVTSRLTRLRSLRVGHPLLDAVLWRNRLGCYCARRSADVVLFSPGPFWSWCAPSTTTVTYHDCIYRHFPRYQGRLWIRRQILRRSEAFLSRCSVVFTESHYSANELSSLLGVAKERIEVIPAWLPPEYSPEHARESAAGVRAKYQLPERYWLYVGGYDYRKNIECLVRAYAAASARRECPALVLAGRIPTDIRKPVCDVHGAIAGSKIAPGRICMPGFIASDDMPGLYGGAELFIYPSLYEGFGLPPLEAMGCGCPAIVADNSSLPEVVGDASYRFPADQEPQLVEMLLAAAEAPLPLNPRFHPARFSESEAITRYVRALSELTRTHGLGPLGRTLGKGTPA